MRKKLLSLSLALVTLVVFTACGGGKGKVDEAAAGKFDEAVSKTMALTSVDLSLDAEIMVKQGSQDVTMTMGAIRQANFKDTKKPEERVSLTVEGGGQNQKIDMYFKDGMLYMAMSGQKFKAKVDYTKVAGIMEEGTNNVGGFDFKSDTMQSLSVKEDGDNSVYEFAIDPKSDKAIAEVKESMLASLNEQFAGSELEVTDFKGTVTVNKDGYMTEQVMTLVMKVKVQGQSADMNMSMNVKFNNPGQDVNVTALTGLNSYTEVDASLLNLD